MTVKKKEIGDEIATRANFYKKDVYEMLDTFVDVIGDTLASGNKIMIGRFITLIPVQIPTRIVRNPQTSDFVESKEHIKIKAKVSKALTKYVNKEKEGEYDGE